MKALKDILLEKLIIGNNLYSSNYGYDIEKIADIMFSNYKLSRYGSSLEDISYLALNLNKNNDLYPELKAICISDYNISKNLLKLNLNNINDNSLKTIIKKYGNILIFNKKNNEVVFFIRIINSKNIEYLKNNIDLFEDDGYIILIDKLNNKYSIKSKQELLD